MVKRACRATLPSGITLAVLGGSLILEFPNVLSASSLAHVRSAVNDAPSPSPSRDIASDVVAALRAHPEFDAALHPAALSSPTFSWHRTNTIERTELARALSFADTKLRVDVCVSMWLSEPSDYEGGEIRIDEGGAVTRWRRNAGDAIAYPASARRRVEPVSAGSLLICTLEVQSLIAGEVERRVLLEFNRARREFERRPESARHAETMHRLCNELIRMWAVIPRRVSTP